MLGGWAEPGSDQQGADLAAIQPGNGRPAVPPRSRRSSATKSHSVTVAAVSGQLLIVPSGQSQ